MVLFGMLAIVSVNKGKKPAKLTAEEKCEEISDDITAVTQNKTIVIKELVENCKSFVVSSILFLSVTIILTGLLIYFYVKSKPNDVLPY